MAEVEHTVKALTIDSTLEDEVKALEADGWSLIPGISPVVIYHLVKVKDKPQVPASASGAGQIRIDDSRVSIIRNGKLFQQ